MISEEINQVERETLIGYLSYAPQLGTKSVTQARDLTGNQTGDLSLRGMMPNQQSHTSQGEMHFKYKYILC